MTLIVAIILLIVGFSVDFIGSHKIHWAARKFIPLFCYGVGFGLLVATFFHWIKS